jgi:hypothetical protein
MGLRSPSPPVKMTPSIKASASPICRETEHDRDGDHERDRHPERRFRPDMDAIGLGLARGRPAVILRAPLDIDPLRRRPPESGTADRAWWVEERRIERLQDAILPPRGKDVAGGRRLVSAPHVPQGLGDVLVLALRESVPHDAAGQRVRADRHIEVAVVHRHSE